MHTKAMYEGSPKTTTQRDVPKEGRRADFASDAAAAFGGGCFSSNFIARAFLSAFLRDESNFMQCCSEVEAQPVMAEAQGTEETRQKNKQHKKG